MIIGLVLLLIAIMVWVVGSIPWLILNYVMCFPEPSIGCADATEFSNNAPYLILLNILLCIFAGFAIAHLRKLHRRHRRRQQLTATMNNPTSGPMNPLG